MDTLSGSMQGLSGLDDQRLNILSQVWRFIEQAIIVTDIKGSILHLNPYAEKLYGWTEAEVQGKNIMQVTVPDISQQRAGEIMDQLAAGESWTGEFVAQRRDGSTFVAEVTNTPVCDEAGNLQTIIGLSQDISEKKQTVEALRKSENMFRLIASNSPDVVFVQDNDLRYTWITNPASTLTPEAVIGKTDMDLLPANESTQLTKFKKTILESGKAKRFELQLSPGGESRWYDAVYYPVYDDARQIKGLASYARDITDLKQSQKKLEQKLTLLEAFHQIDRMILSTTDLKISLETILEKLCFELNIDAAVVFSLNSYMQTLEYRHGHGFRNKDIHKYSSLRVGEGLAGQAAKDVQVASIPDLSKAREKFKLSRMLQGEDFVTAHAIPLVVKGQVNGVLEIFQRSPFMPDDECLDVLNMFAGQTAIAISNMTLFNDLQRMNSDLIQAYDETIEGWARALDLRDNETEGHSRRVTELTLKLARAAGVKEEELANIRRGALLHDIGKVGVPDAILQKPGKLTDDEWVIMRKHTTYAFELLSPITYLRPAIDIPYCHHENWDGSGYPRGLKGEQIPLAARLFAVVDIWDALRSDRPYRQGWSKEKTLEHILSLSGTELDPRIVDLFVDMIQTEETVTQNQDE